MSLAQLSHEHNSNISMTQKSRYELSSNISKKHASNISLIQESRYELSSNIKVRQRVQYELDFDETVHI